VVKVLVVESSQLTETGLASAGVTRVQSTMESAIGAPEATPWTKAGSAARAREQVVSNRVEESNFMEKAMLLHPPLGSMIVR
jgi:hypothetical protein